MQVPGTYSSVESHHNRNEWHKPTQFCGRQSVYSCILAYIDWLLWYMLRFIPWNLYHRLPYLDCTIVVVMVMAASIVQVAVVPEAIIILEKIHLPRDHSYQSPHRITTAATIIIDTIPIPSDCVHRKVAVRFWNVATRYHGYNEYIEYYHDTKRHHPLRSSFIRLYWAYYRMWRT